MEIYQQGRHFLLKYALSGCFWVFICEIDKYKQTMQVLKSNHGFIYVGTSLHKKLFVLFLHIRKSL